MDIVHKRHEDWVIDLHGIQQDWVESLEAKCARNG